MPQRLLQAFYALFTAVYGLLTLAAWLAGIGAALQGELLVAALFMGVTALAGALVVEALREAGRIP